VGNVGHIVHWEPIGERGNAVARVSSVGNAIASKRKSMGTLVLLLHVVLSLPVFCTLSTAQNSRLRSERPSSSGMCGCEGPRS
jgi:uncharacterized membrane protein YadS